MNRGIPSGLLVKIYEQVCKLLREIYDKAKADVENNYHQYYEIYLKRHGIVKVSCIQMRKPIPLDDVYVRVQFLDQHTISRYNSPENVEKAFQDRNRIPFDSVSDEHQDGIQVANEKQYLMVLGGPGVGKSTFLRKVGIEALKGKNGNFKHECVPVFLELKNFKEDQIDIEALIINEMKTCGFPHPEELTQDPLKLGNFLILFDGLDEVPSANVDNVIDKIGDFVTQYSQNRFIVSSRVAAYKGGFKRFTEVEIADFDNEQIQSYINNWFDSTPDEHQHQLDEKMRIAKQCWETLNTHEHKATKELARNPLLLTLLCMVYEDTQNLSLNRATLYKEALDLFLRKWADEKGVNRGASITQYLDIVDEKQMLSEIAAKNFKANRFLFSEDELITQIREFGKGNANTLETFNAPKILDAILIDQGLFIEPVSGSYSFSHLTFQEYFTANYIKGHPQSIQALVEEHLHDEQWREVFLLTAGLMRKADDLLIAMETEAKKSINTNSLKCLLQWAEQIIDTTDDKHSRPGKRAFVIRQYFSLWLLNKIDDWVQKSLQYDYYTGSTLDHYRNLILKFDFLFHSEPDLSLCKDLLLNLDRDLYPNLYRYLRWYDNSCRSFALYPYQDFYRYTDADFYRRVPSEFRHRFDKELEERITLIKIIEGEKIFKDVDLQRMVQLFNAQREFIKAAGKGESVEPPAESINDTWLSILGITDEMLSSEGIGTYLQYPPAVYLIIACKEAAEHVSPDVWQRIEDRFFTVHSGNTT